MPAYIMSEESYRSCMTELTMLKNGANAGANSDSAMMRLECCLEGVAMG